MKRTIVVSMLLAMTRVMLGGESSLTTTYQPLDGLGSSEIAIVQVTCHDWFSHSGQPTAIGLISAPNIPPTNNPKDATENLTLASVCGVRFVASDIGDSQAPRELMLDATNFVIPKRFGYPREKIIRSCLECLRLCLPGIYRDRLPIPQPKSNPGFQHSSIHEFKRLPAKNSTAPPPTATAFGKRKSSPATSAAWARRPIPLVGSWEVWK